MSAYTTEQKYNFLLSLLQITDVDLWENDALLAMGNQYFQWSELLGDDNVWKDIAVEWIMKDRGE